MMEFIKWSTEYETGIQSLDQQHKTYLSILNRLYEETTKESISSKKEIDEVLVELRNYAVNQFDIEEDLMDVNDYPGFEKHRKQHEALKNDLKSYILAFEKNNLEAVAIANFLSQWFKDHFRNMDKAYASYLKEKGVI